MTAKPIHVVTDTCGVTGCPCDHDPAWSPSHEPCDHGFTTDDGQGRARRCRRCAEHAKTRAQEKRS